MEKKYKTLNLHQRMEILIDEMIEKELHLKDVLREFEKIYLQTASKKYNGNKTRMAKALGVHRNTLHNRAKKLKIAKKIRTK
ncbi:MAG: helix-turn-helix domain-containing protein [Candidatus Aminicenantaceae bacterium]